MKFADIVAIGAILKTEHEYAIVAGDMARQCCVRDIRRAIATHLAQSASFNGYEFLRLCGVNRP